ncbi:MAG: metallophosphoesterase, partial [Clostridia bacterium]|nr:metallophosphoesterase [Clostridia bacterium]
MKKRILSLAMAIVMLFSVISLCPMEISAAIPDAETVGMTFTDSSEYVWKMDKLLTVAPHTFEVWIKVAEGETGSGSGRVGNIFNNYIGSGSSTICFDIHNNGAPRLYWGNTSNSSASVTFNTDVRTGEWLHLAVVLDEAEGKAHCYINGALADSQTKTAKYDVNRDLATLFSLGGDNRPSNTKYYFRGAMSGFSAYGDALTASEIADIYKNGPALTNSSIVCAYDLPTSPAGNVIEDISGKGYAMYITDPKVNVPVDDGTEETPDDGEEGETEIIPGATVSTTRPTDYAYSFAVVGDTQYLVENDVNRGTDNNGALYDWIVANKDKKKIKQVFGLGDITDDRTDVAQWVHAKAGISKLDGILPYYLIRGNHDNSDSFNEYFNNPMYTSQFNDPDIEDQSKCFFEEGKIDNAYTKFTIGETKYLLMLLDYGANDAVLNWAGSIIAANPTYRVIINTHGYLSSDGSPLDNESYSPDPDGSGSLNNGVEMWDKLMKKHRNILLVLCGHDPYATNSSIMMLRTRGENKNVVTQLLIDPQSLDWDNPGTTEDDNDQQYGMVAMLYFNEDGSRVWVEYISTALTTEENGDYLYRAENQFSFDLILTEKNDIAEVDLIAKSGLTEVYRIYYTNGSYSDYTVQANEIAATGSPIKLGSNGNWWIGGSDLGIYAGESTEPPKDNNVGMSFDNSVSSIYKTEQLLTRAPHTFEVWIKVAVGETGSGSGRVGNIFNNFLGTGNSAICFDIQTNGNPRLYWGYSTSSQANIKFDQVDVRTGEWLHLAVVLDASALKLHCYINGELKQTKTAPADYAERDLATLFCLGRDNRSAAASQSYYFHGSMAGFSAYADALDAAAIAEIYAKGPAYGNSSIICAYDLITPPTGGSIKDASGNGNTLYITPSTVNTPVARDKIAGASLSIGEDLSVLYSVSLSRDSIVGYSMKFTFNGVQTLVEEAILVNGVYYFAFAGVSPERMGDNIKAELVYEGTTVATRFTYSVREYASHWLAKEDITPELKQLLTDLLEYGARAQLYKGYKTYDLVNEGIDGIGTQGSSVPTKTDKSNTKAEGYEGESIVESAGVRFAALNRIYLTLKTCENVTVRVNGVALDFYGNTVYTDGIKAYELYKVIAFEIYVG